MARAEEERRIDLVMRQYVAEILRYLARGGDHANARMNMTERGVPTDVQQRVIDGDAASE